ncbi:hypothetical protein SAMN06269185_3212 [Natronoarchaeum philippinense]|uniref:Uncharacterized protein n=1 Tax=Natronoarchaeum philippinense TaxID=558529 RepID=A0A285P8K1_NATPI|nr:hypothetical protein SAMN06269185_3212 [Natronoarchaeum philippinense]
MVVGAQRSRMDRSQIIALFFVFLMVSSLVAMTAAAL